MAGRKSSDSGSRDYNSPLLLTPGTLFGPYRIVAPLGAGGMGEVYRAHDPRLNREVALKFVRSEFTAADDRLQRFAREAQTLAALNHPHIAQIHGIEESETPEAPGQTLRALVMEFVEGEDLSASIARGALPLDESCEIAKQIAEALEAAHEQGIVHRDLKPANVKVKRDGTVKVLDFGLAKALEGGSASASVAGLANSPTMASPAMTAAGMILGTAAYMSPEQARGKPVDKRADIWAFGCVLYEMLTGRLAFDAVSVTDTLSAITRDDPNWKLLPPQTPPRVAHLLERCLQKDANERLRDIGEARIALSDRAARVLPTPATGSRRHWGAAAALLVAAGAIVAAYLLGQRSSPPAALVVNSFTQLTDQPGFERQPTISPDGRSVVYVSDARGNADLYLLRVGGRNTVLLTGDSDADDYAPAFSRDGNRLAFRSERAGGGIFIMEATGESVRRVSDFGFDPHWSPDGNSLVVADEGIVDPMSRHLRSALWVMDVANGSRRRVAREDAVGGRWSPGGRRLAYWGRADDTAIRDILTVASDGSEAESPIKVTDDAAVDWGPTWSPDGRFLYFASNRGGTMNLWRIPIDEASGRVGGAAEAVTTPTAWGGWFEVSGDGSRIVFAELEDRTTVWATGFDPEKGEVVGQPRVALQGLAINSIDLSANGQKIVFTQRGQPWEALGTIRIDGSAWSRLTDDDVYHRVPAWSPDGTQLAFYRSNGIWILRDDGSGLRQLEVPAELSHAVYPVWSPDGSRLAVAGDTTSAVVDLSSQRPRIVALQPMPDNSSGLLPMSWSADGRLIAGTTRERGGLRDQVFVCDETLGPIRLVARSGKSPAWLPDSRRLLYSSPTGIMVLDVNSGREREVLPLRRTELLWGRLISLSRDGRTLVYLQPQSEGDVWLMSINAK